LLPVVFHQVAPRARHRSIDTRFSRRRRSSGTGGQWQMEEASRMIDLLLEKLGHPPAGCSLNFPAFNLFMMFSPRRNRLLYPWSE